jgi:hypothetical protein
MAISFSDEAKRKHKEEGHALFKFVLTNKAGRLEVAMPLDAKQEKEFTDLWLKWTKQGKL